ncbi:MAG: repeat protein [Mucilaginibacter sp.]|nr:repeat protein [Mucilaginibacter sp.]
MKTKNLYIIYLLAVVSICSGVTLLNGCSSQVGSTYKLTGNVITDGEKLVQLKCTGCHKLVPADALSESVWTNHTLPSMAKYLHISTYGGTQYFKNNPADTTGISLENWMAIVAYYKKIAPAELPAARRPVPLINDWAIFSLKKPDEIKELAYTTMVAWGPDAHKIYSSDASDGRLYEWGPDLKPQIVADMPSPVVSAKFLKNSNGIYQGIFTCIGQLAPMDFPNGRVLSFEFNNSGTKPAPALIASELARPVQTIDGDFNKDGLTDFVILGQGNVKGRVYLFKQNPDHTYTQTNISDKPGAVQAVAGDFNNDGWQDIMVLFGTGDEGLWLFLNDHKGGFTIKNLLRFPPVYSSTSFQLADMDHDGQPDLIYTCGYNYHDSRILKPYHGLYIFKNMGNWNFKQQWFYPINGCTKAIAADFDGDGDLDIATSAFFADMKNNPSESFIYFEQEKPFSFKPHAVPVSNYGRWMSMDIGDFNNDGKPDIVLGNYSSGFAFQRSFNPFWNKHLPLIVLENHSKKQAH